MKKGDIIELKVDSIGFEGVAVGRYEGMVCFLKKAVPGDLVKAKVYRKKKNFMETSLVEVIEPSSNRIEPPCSHFKICGGCSWQNMHYQEQLKWKEQIVKDSFERIGNLEVEKFYEIMQSEKIFEYRNKMDFSFGASRWLENSEIRKDEVIDDRNFALGLHIPGRYDKILDIEKCHIQDDLGNHILNSIREEAKKRNLNAYDVSVQDGFLRSLIIRKSVKFNQLMIILVTKSASNEDEDSFLRWFYADFTNRFQVKEIIHAVNNTKNPSMIDNWEVVKGDGYISEKILDVEYKISPFSFFQTNSYQLDKFISKIIEFADIEYNHIIWDLFCGTGSITLPIAQEVEKVYGIELVESSINDARQNAVANEIKNVEFFAADLNSKKIPELLYQLQKPDTIILDPPRAGLSKNLIDHLHKVKSNNIVYVSCNPTTQARDIALLAESYKVAKLIPVDMFPHTYHVETIAKLELKENG